MIYSVPKPGGGFEYYEAAQEHYIGDDLPALRYSSVQSIGTPSYELGVPLPGGARHVGSGAIPKGLLAPMRKIRGGTLGSFSDGTTSYAWLGLAGLGMGLVGFFAWRAWK